MAIRCPECQKNNPDTLKFCGECGSPLHSIQDGNLTSHTKTLGTPAEEFIRGTIFAERYEIIEELGSGGMGKVFRVEDTKTKEELALKLIKPEISSDRKTLDRFSNELKLTHKISHRNVCRMFHLGEEKGTHFITMEYVPGEDLKSLIKRIGRLDSGTAIKITKQICDGLSEAHGLGVIHRDLKPANIMIDKEGNTRIMDFGIARSLKAQGLTGEGVIIGTPEYMSPEQVEGKEVDRRSDIYSLGVILYEMVAGQLPFKGDTPLSVALKHKTEIPSDPRKANPQISGDLSSVILRCMEKNREKRYQDAEELLSELNRIEEGIPTEERILPKMKPQVKRKGETRQKNLILYSIVAALLFALIAAGGYFLFLQVKSIDSIAVLPFENENPDPETEYLSDGLTETLIDKISQLPQIKKVISRHTIFTYKGQSIDPIKVGEELDVKAVLLSRMRQSEDKLSLSVELINTRDNSHIWGKKYDKKLEDVFAIEEEMATEIAQALNLKPKEHDRELLTKRHTSNTEAYKLYLMGRHSTRKITQKGFQEAFNHFHQALEIDPTYALAYSGLSNLYFMLGYFKLLPPNDAYPRAKAAAEKALELDNNLAEAHHMLANVNLFYEWDWPSAKSEYKKVSELNQNYEGSRIGDAYYLAIMGRHEDSIVEAKRSLELDPLSDWSNAYYGLILLFARKYDLAIDHLQGAIKIHPNSINLHMILGWNYSLKGLHEEAIKETEKAVELSGKNPMMVGRLGRVLAAAGRQEEAQNILNEMLNHLKPSEVTGERVYVSPYYIAIIYLKLGQKDLAFDWLERAFETQDDMIVHLKADPDFEVISADPRFQSLLKKMNLE